MSVSITGGQDKQTRIQSPSYPSMGLEEAVAKVRRIETRYRSSVVDRVEAAKLLGYAGMTGPSAMALAALVSFGLLERAGKGEVRATERARAILHSDDPAELAAALREAAYTPSLYRELRDRFSDVPVPPEEGVVSYLNRQGFNTVAVRPAAKAFLQTMQYLEKSGVSESSGHQRKSGGDSEAQTKREDAPPMTSSTLIPAPAPPVPPPIFGAGGGDSLALNEPNLSIRGGTVRVEALLDYDGLSELEDQIKALRMILKPRRSVTADRPLPLANAQTEGTD